MKNTLRPMIRAVGEKRVPTRQGEDQVIIWWRSVWVGQNPSGPPGGGSRECARRRRQILAGQLNRSNGFEGGLDAMREAYELEHPRVIVLGRAA